MIDSGERFSYHLPSCITWGKEWFDKYDKLHYSLENKLIKMNKSLIEKINDPDWKNDYIIREDHELFEKK